ncbi:hypothetical protein A4H97_20040 [Niastella yeongjuensis]|uniref:Uncharacterized protein n=1 Tax=Niastella yeongjuensis TaxID=354355 RepID=A0A1V9FBZ7_9BACT|nr:hypothetical protein [Niastella yeongjuensis]OQP55884.1 hypothetical protein A4H97_20040 [Niastella yeongjuensis]SEP47121.1 hypothetical protein SAMN05660816_06540 [Niastella yeongjuensis]
MKLKVAIASLAVVATAVVAFAFTTAHKPTVDTTFYYQDENKFIGTGDVNSIDASALNNPDKWDVDGSASFTTGDYLAAISFNLDEVNPANGGSDGDLTMQEAIDAVKALYQSSGSLPLNNSSFMQGSTVITIHRRSTN